MRRKHYEEQGFRVLPDGYINFVSNQHPLDKALKEFGKTIKSIFILNYVDDIGFRKAIEKQLNKGESSNKFSQAVAFGNNQEFMQGEKVEQEIGEGCRRLIKNAVICWKYLYRAQLIAETDEKERRQQIISAVMMAQSSAHQPARRI